MPRLVRYRALSANALSPLPLPRRHQSLAHLLKVAAYAALLLGLSSLLLARYRIEQTSMEPNFYPGQRVIVSQAGRAFGSWINGSAYAAPPVSAAMGLSRGQVVVFYETDDHSLPPLIKRLIGLPGDQVQIRGGEVFINNARLPEPYLSSATTECAAYCSLTLGVNEYFFMGDNRSVSRDSREFGPVHGDHVIGRVVMRFWPLDQVTFFL